MTVQTFYRLNKIAADGDPVNNTNTNTTNSTEFNFGDTISKGWDWFTKGTSPWAKGLRWGIPGAAGTWLIASLLGSQNPMLWGLLGGIGFGWYGSQRKDPANTTADATNPAVK